MSLVSINESKSFSYNGGIETFTPAVAGTYKLEVYGAQGGASLNNGSVNDNGGKGGYSSGYIHLNKGQTIYICVGGKGGTGVKLGTAAGGYNGGGSGSSDGSDDEAAGGGGGATHIAFVTGTLASIGVNNKDKVIIVAGGGGGRSFTYTAGTGGGTNGGTGATSSSYPTQVSGYAFGQGQNGVGAASSDGVAGGGGGWYGGYANNVASKSSGTGGSGYIGGVLNGTTTNGQRTGHGEAIITLTDISYDLYLGEKPIFNIYIGNKNLSI
jgi:hypothetical protein